MFLKSCFWVAGRDFSGETDKCNKWNSKACSHIVCPTSTIAYCIYQMIYRLDALPTTQPTVCKHSLLWLNGVIYSNPIWRTACYAECLSECKLWNARWYFTRVLTGVRPVCVLKHWMRMASWWMTLYSTLVPARWAVGCCTSAMLRRPRQPRPSPSLWWSPIKPRRHSSFSVVCASRWNCARWKLQHWMNLRWRYISEMNPAKKSKSAIYNNPLTVSNDFCELNLWLH